LNVSSVARQHIADPMSCKCTIIQSGAAGWFVGQSKPIKVNRISGQEVTRRNAVLPESWKYGNSVFTAQDDLTCTVDEYCRRLKTAFKESQTSAIRSQQSLKYPSFNMRGDSPTVLDKKT
jgi:hypothetical protein